MVPASPEQNVSVPNEASQIALGSLENGATEIPTLDQTMSSNKEPNVVAVQDMSSDQPKKSRRRKNDHYCCFLPPIRGKGSMVKSKR